MHGPPLPRCCFDLMFRDLKEEADAHRQANVGEGHSWPDQLHQLLSFFFSGANHIGQQGSGLAHP